MRSVRHVLIAACCAAVGVIMVSGAAHAQYRVTPGPDEVLKVDQVMILVDVTGSTRRDAIFGMKHNGVFEREKSLVIELVNRMPDMDYQGGFSSFAGWPVNDWDQLHMRKDPLWGLTVYSRNYQYLGRSTPLRYGVEVSGGEFRPENGRAALIVFSDGITRPHEPILEQCRDINDALDGQLCVYTINVGSSDSGRELLQEMAAVTGCGYAWQAPEVESPAGMEAMVRQIFFGAGQRAESPPPMEDQGRTVVISAEVLFDFDRSELKPEGKQAINTIVGEMHAASDEHVVIEGHTCDLGSNAYNMSLSQRRADSVQAYMTAQGIDGRRISTEAYGETRPAVPNTSEENRKLNRRAEFRFTINR